MQDGRRRYRIIGLLGQGSQGRVYLAEQIGLGGFRRRVAIKALDEAHLEDERRLRDLLAEARRAAQVHHRAVAQVNSLVRLEERWCLVMEYVPGVDLHTLVRERPISPRAALELVGEVARALHAALDDPGFDGEPTGLVHRDIKGGNIRVTPHGGVKILDFGVARSLERLEITHWAGTPTYRAPECIFEDSPGSSAADIFALGTVMVAAITGKRPGLVPPAEYYPAHVAHIDDNLEKAGASEGLRQLVGRMLEMDPAHRLTAAEVDRRCSALERSELGPRLVAHARNHPDAWTWSTPEGDPWIGVEMVEMVDADQVDVGNVPAATGELIARDDAVMALHEGLQRRAVCVLRGPAGVGTSRVAQHVALERQSMCPGGAWWVDCSKVRSGDTLWRELRRVVPSRCLKVNCPDDTLIVLDGLRDVGGELPACVTSLMGTLSHLGCLITTHDPMEVSEAVTVDLGRWSTEDEQPSAVELLLAPLRERTPSWEPTDAEKGHASAIVAAVDGLPLALQIAGQLLTTRGIAVVRRQLSQDLFALAEVDPRLLESVAQRCQELSRPAVASLLQLGVFEESFSVADALAVVDVSQMSDAPSVEDLLRQLQAKHLVAYEAKHDLPWRVLRHVRTWVFERWRDKVPMVDEHRYFLSGPLVARAVLHRYCIWFARFGEEDTVRNIRAGVGDERTLAIAQRREVLAAGFRALQWNLQQQALQCACSALTIDSMTAGASGRGLAQRVLRKPAEVSASEMVRLACQLANDYVRSGDTAAAVSVLDTAENDPRLQSADFVRIQLARARILRTTGDLGQALSLAAISAKNAQDSWTKVLGWTLAGICQSGRGDEVRSLRAFDRALAACTTPLQRAKVLDLRAYRHMRTGDLTRAQEEWTEALELAETQGADVIMVWIMSNLARVSAARLDMTSARKLYTHSIRRARELRVPEIERRCWYSWGNALLAVGELQQAMRALKTSLRQARRVSDHAVEAAATKAIGDVWRLQGEHDTAKRTLNKARAMYQQIGDSTHEVDVIASLAAMEAANSTPGEAITALRESVDTFGRDRSQFEPVHQALLLSLEAGCDLRHLEPHLTKLRQQHAVFGLLVALGYGAIVLRINGHELQARALVEELTSRTEHLDLTPQAEPLQLLRYARSLRTAA